MYKKTMEQREQLTEEEEEGEEGKKLGGRPVMIDSSLATRHDGREKKKKGKPLSCEMEPIAAS